MLVRLGIMRDLLEDLDAIGDATVEALQEDRVVLRAVERILTQLVDTASAANAHAATTLGQLSPRDYRETFDAAAVVGLIGRDQVAALKESVRVHDVLMHAGNVTDLAIVEAAIPLARREYATYVRTVAAWLQARS